MTAVEWLHDKWSNCEVWNWEEIEKWFEQAKQMEKESQYKFFVGGMLSTEEGGKDFLQFYKKQYNKDA